MYLVGRLGGKCTFNAYLSTKYDFTTAELGISKRSYFILYLLWTYGHNSNSNIWREMNPTFTWTLSEKLNPLLTITNKFCKTRSEGYLNTYLLYIQFFISCVATELILSGIVYVKIWLILNIWKLCLRWNNYVLKRYSLSPVTL